MSGKGKGGKRKAAAEPTAEGAESPAEKTATPPTKRITRSRTMASTAKEGKAFLSEGGNKDLVNVPGTQRETRSRHKARAVLDSALGNNASSTGEFDEKKAREEFHLVFRVFDRDRDGHITEVEIADIMRSMGKRPLKAKIRSLVAAIDTNKNGKIEEEEFVNYMVNHKKEKLSKAPKEAKAAKGAKGKAKKPEKVSRGASIYDYYNTGFVSATPAAAASGAAAPGAVTATENPTGSHYDLGMDAAFGEFTVLVYIGAYPELVKKWVPPIFEKKGFKHELTSDVVEFLKKLPDADEAWIISGPPSAGDKGHAFQDWSKVSKDEFAKQVIAFHRSGKGLALFGEDEPLTTEANAVLEALYGVTLVGNTPGGEELSLASLNGVAVSGFSPHLLTSGLNFMFEGQTVCYPKDDNVGPLKVLAVSNDKHPLIMYEDYQAPLAFGADQAHGRVVVDCSYTKLWQMESSGRERYFQNLAVWLVSLESRLSFDFPAKKKVEQPTKFIWQYKSGGWYNYNQAASDTVEECYQDYLRNPANFDVRAVKSGHWAYLVDFPNMRQTNVQHEAHTVREIRRVPISLSVE